MFRFLFWSYLSILSLAAGAAHAQTVFQATLNGGQETPPVATAGSGSGLLLYDPLSSLLSYSIGVSGLSSAVTDAHVHIGNAGVGGPILFSLAGGPTLFSGIAFVDPVSDLPVLQASGLYANIHTSMFPGGEIRGQIVPARNRFDAVLSGAKEVPPNGSAATGSGTFVLNPNKTITYALTVSGVTGTAAHIHLGAPGVSGPILFPLAGGPTSWAGTTAALSDLQVAQLQSSLMYANVHSAAFPLGEIRGQIVPSFTTYGTACSTSLGTTPSFDGSGVSSPGSGVTFSVTGGLPGGAGALFITLSGLQLPVAGGCTLWVNPVPLFLQLPVSLDGAGSLSLPIGLPSTLPAPLWIQLQYFGADPGKPNGYHASGGLSMHINN